MQNPKLHAVNPGREDNKATSWKRMLRVGWPGRTAPSSPHSRTTFDNGGAIPPVLSIYLDLVRFLAAVIVVLYHTWKQFFPESQIKWPGHEAVVVFFVLSGYVIAHAASRPGMTLFIYVQHRIARIIPVAWVALFLALVLSIQKGEYPVRATLANLVFLAQSGVGWIEAPINPPFWSLNYEVWYYVIFAAWLYAPRQHRTALTALAMLMAGPKILLLLPVWLMGVWLYRRMPALGEGTAALLFIATLGAASALCWLNVSDIFRSWLYREFVPAWRLHYSTQFIYDILLGVVVSIHFASVAALEKTFSKLIRFERPIRYLAGFTFSIYVFHAPLGELYEHGMSPFLFYGELALCIFLLAQMTERRTAFFRRLLKHGAVTKLGKRP
jgi:peptidoglycan/LPS O-acetylase OafA/YrhL